MPVFPSQRPMFTALNINVRTRCGILLPFYKVRDTNRPVSRYPGTVGYMPIEMRGSDESIPIQAIWRLSTA